MSGKKMRALEQRVAQLTRENEARKRAACEHPAQVWTHNVLGAPDQFAGVMDFYQWKCDDCGMSSGGNHQGTMDGWPEWIRRRFGAALADMRSEEPHRASLKGLLGDDRKPSYPGTPGDD